MNGTKLTTLQKNRSKWENEQHRFQPMMYVLPPGGNPWKETEHIMKSNLSQPLSHTYGMSKKDRNEYIRQNDYLNRTKEFYTNNADKLPGYYGPCNR